MVVRILLNSLTLPLVKTYGVEYLLGNVSRRPHLLKTAVTSQPFYAVYCTRMYMYIFFFPIFSYAF